MPRRLSPRDDDHLAYGDYHSHHHTDDGLSEEQNRGFFGDVVHRLRRPHTPPHSSHPSVTETYQPHLSSSAHQSPFSNQPHQASSSPSFWSTSTSSGTMAGIFGKVQELTAQMHTKLSGLGGGSEEPAHSHVHHGGECHDGAHEEAHTNNRYVSFAPERDGNDVKWYVDGKSYMWALSVALEQARESVWILDWWLSPELYLRRPPAKYEKYRLDNMLKAAAERGVKVNVIVYKEVTQALTRKYLNPTLPNYLLSLFPESTDRLTMAMSRLGMAVIFKSLEETERTDPLIKPPIPVSSSHTKHHLEDQHQNIAVFRHPDHLPDQQSLASSFFDSIKNIRLNAAELSKLPGDALGGIYGISEGTVMFWAHHEKLCLIDGKIAFMGGLDLCFGRYDTNDHPIADAHPQNMDDTIFPGQDFNNSRIMDFDVQDWHVNKLDRSKFSRMGWSDIALSVHGPVITDLKEHFIQRWNYLYNEKYASRTDTRYCLLQHRSGAYQTREGAEEGEEGERGLFSGHSGGFMDKLKHRFEEEMHRHGGHQQSGEQQQQQQHQQMSASEPRMGSGISCQLTRSCCRWSHGCKVEHSIANAYINIIRNSEHFIYIENQFFITATSDEQRPVKNKIGAAIVERILRAARNGEKYHMIVIMPAVPAFAGDLHSDGALGTRAIMEFQYDSISRGGHSIYETIAREGYNPLDYIRFYNLRNYDRINASGAMKEAEEKSGVRYDEARKEYDATYGGGFAEGGSGGPQEGEGYGDRPQWSGDRPYAQYQEAARQVGSRHGNNWDSVSSCYMLGGEDIRNVPWEQGDIDEIDAFVSEELYIHSKLLIADDRTVIIGSANLNDRSQLGDHDSEIALVINDPTPADMTLNGQPWRASRFATSLRRQIFRKHLGLLPAQPVDAQDANSEPVGMSPQQYDFGSREDELVADPLSPAFAELWNATARTNTDVFSRVFHNVPNDAVKNWTDYEEFYEKLFREADPEKPDEKPPGKYKVGHVVRDEFPGGVDEVKECLSRVRGTLVEMPLMFLKEEDIAKEGMTLNSLTEELYT